MLKAHLLFVSAGWRVHGHVWHDGRINGKHGEYTAISVQGNCVVGLNITLCHCLILVVFFSLRNKCPTLQTVRHFPLQQWSPTPPQTQGSLKFISRPVKREQALEGWELPLFVEITPATDFSSQISIANLTGCIFHAFFIHPWQGPSGLITQEFTSNCGGNKVIICSINIIVVMQTFLPWVHPECTASWLFW